MPKSLPSDLAQPYEFENFMEWEGQFSALAGSRNSEFLLRGTEDEDVPQGKEFIGREAELNELTTWVSDSSPSIKILIGSRGVGKTTLIQKLVSQMPSTSVFWFCSNAFKYFKPEWDAETLFNILPEFADYSNIPTAKNTLSKKIGESQRDFLFVWDPVDWNYFCKEPILESFSILLNKLSEFALKSYGIIVAGESSDFIDHSAVPLHTSIMRLKAFRKNEALDFLLSSLVSQDILTQRGFLASLAKASCGHPLILKYAVSHFNKSSESREPWEQFASSALLGMLEDALRACDLPIEWGSDIDHDDMNVLRCLVQSSCHHSVRIDTLSARLDIQTKELRRRLWKRLESWEQNWQILEINSAQELISFRDDLVMPTLRTIVFHSEWASKIKNQKLHNRCKKNRNFS